MEAKTFTHLVPTRIPSFDSITEKKKFRPSLTVRRISLMMDVLDVSAERVRTVLSALGDVVPGTDYLAPKVLPQPTIQQWFSGRTQLPLHRAAQLIMVLESAMVEQEADARRKYVEDDPAFLVFATVKKIIAELEKDEALRLLTDRFRITMRRLLREGVADKTAEKARYENYAKYLAAREVTAKNAARKTEGEK